MAFWRPRCYFRGARVLKFTGLRFLEVPRQRIPANVQRCRENRNTSSFTSGVISREPAYLPVGTGGTLPGVFCTSGANVHTSQFCNQTHPWRWSQIPGCGFWMSAVTRGAAAVQCMRRFEVDKVAFASYLPWVGIRQCCSCRQTARSATAQHSITTLELLVRGGAAWLVGYRSWR